ncbi:MAG TPA: hypothetical protein VE967_14865 [Gemmatimonadaceae bacterium]|nr:hypothetical protein [Gemmatimonadaceae bacterium]
MNQALSEYPDILFEDGDLVTVSAGGCVNHGGMGSTWKRYVNPVGNKADRYYHGLIQFLGGPPGPIRLQEAMQHPWKVRSRGLVSPASLTLYLGYEDDEYGDNSYKDHDDGVNNQCKSVGDAFVELTIVRNGVAPTEPPPSPMDLEGLESIDRPGTEEFPATDIVNLLPINPRWGLQRTHWPQRPDPDGLCFESGTPTPPNGLVLPVPLFDDPRCTTQHPSVDVPGGFPNLSVCVLGSGKIKGHVNYFPAIFTGAVQFEGLNNGPAGLLGDHDYSFFLLPDNNAGLSAQDREGTIEIEFDTHETINEFETAWWSKFHKDVDDGHGRQLGPRTAIVAGLVGLDCQHGCKTEIHPVFAMAMLVDETTTGNQTDQTWAVFVRDVGDEGSCSSAMHRFSMPEGAFHFALPWPRNVTQFSVGAATDFRSNGGVEWEVRALPSHRAVVLDVGRFPRTGSVDPTLFYGELHLVWSGPTTPVRPQFPESEHVKTGTSMSAIYDQMMTVLSPQQLALYKANTVFTRAIQTVRSTQAASLPSQPPSPAGVTTSLACKKMLRDAREYDVYLRALTNQPMPLPGALAPGAPDACYPTTKR